MGIIRSNINTFDMRRELKRKPAEERYQLIKLAIDWLQGVGK